MSDLSTPTPNTAAPPTPSPAAASSSLWRTVVLKLDRRTVNGFLVLAGVLGGTYVLMFHTPPSDAEKYLTFILGALVAMSKDVIGYDFGSSAGSEKKDDAMITAAQKGPTT